MLYICLMFIAAARAEAYLQEKMRELDSSGGIVECVITGMPVGIGEPVFDKLRCKSWQSNFIYWSSKRF